MLGLNLFRGRRIDRVVRQDLYGARVAPTAAFFDLDRTLLSAASAPILADALREEGLEMSSLLPGERALAGLVSATLLDGVVFDALGDTRAGMLLARRQVRGSRGWEVAALQRAGARAAPRLAAAVEPFVADLLGDHRRAGRLLVLAATPPRPLLEPFAERMGFDDLIATHHRVGPDGRCDGTIDGEFVWGRGKSRSVKAWARSHRIELVDSYAYADSVHDAPLLAAVGHPVAVNPDPRLWATSVLRGWPTIWLGAPMVGRLSFGLDPQQLVAALVRDEFLPFVHIEVVGLDHLPADGPAIVLAPRGTQLDPLLVAYAAAQVGRPARFLARTELVDAPVVGPIIRALGAIGTTQRASGADPLRRAVAALRSGALVAVEDEADARALARRTKAPLIPITIAGSELVWPRDRALPYLLNLADPPTVSITIGGVESASPSGVEIAANDVER